MTHDQSHHEMLIVGAGVVGLSLAWRLAARGADVCVIDRGEPGRGASWAGAGMVPTGPSPAHWAAASAIERLAGLSDRLHEQWHEQLLDETGVDNGYRRCGAVYLATDPSTAAELATHRAHWDELGVEHVRVDAERLADLEPVLNRSSEYTYDAALIAADAQIRNPRHVRALLDACRNAGVSVVSHSAVRQLQVSDEAIIRARTDHHAYHAEQCCIASGCWSAEIANSLGVELSVRPVRGQIVLLAGTPGLMRRNINAGSRYLVARDDGRVLVGSTEEEAGFDPCTTADGVDGLLKFAVSLAPALGEMSIEQSWAGLRPATVDGLPYIGRVADRQGVWAATGHFRAGLQLSSGTAEVMSQLMTGEQPSVNIDELSPSRNVESEPT